jgi:hypothetical protein
VASGVTGSLTLAARDLATNAKAIAGNARDVQLALPAGAVPELVASVERLRRVRTPRQAVDTFETETERLLTVIAPLLIEKPLPVRRARSAKAIVATAGGLAAAGDELEELAALVSYGAALPPALPMMIATNLTALAVEIYVAASLRVHDLEAAGVRPDPDAVARDVIYAMTGKAPGKGGMSKHVTKQMVKSVVARVLSRWGAAFVPLVGIAYSGWDSQRTIDAVRSLPIPSPDLDAIEVAHSVVGD